DRYRRRLSGPILDRIDLHISIPRLMPEELVSLEGKCGESSAEVAERVRAAREIQVKRWSGYGIGSNSEIPEKLLRRKILLTPEVKSFLLRALNRVRLSGRGLSRVLKVSRTIADLAGSEEIKLEHVAEALSYREGEALSWMKI
ncbi:MAG: ATP-binding protein, partial [Synergistaceae bacterium]|nr:ATP-binding protein [Synergistaceae bacterium]